MWSLFGDMGRFKFKLNVSAADLTVDVRNYLCTEGCCGMIHACSVDIRTTGLQIKFATEQCSGTSDEEFIGEMLEVTIGNVRQIPYKSVHCM